MAQRFDCAVNCKLLVLQVVAAADLPVIEHQKGFFVQRNVIATGIPPHM